MSERKASMGDKVYRGDVVKFIRNNISLGTFMKRTVKTANEACWDLCDKLNYVPAIEDKNEPHWIPVTERLPEEEDSIFARYYGTDRWRKAMFRKKSREVIVTSVFEDGELHTEVAHTTDGEWHVGVNVVPRTVIAWMPLPESYKGVTE